MAGWWTNRGKKEVTDLGVGGADLRVLLVTTAPASAAAAADLNFVSDVVANEAAGTGYARKTLTGETVIEDDSNDRARIDADDPATYSGANFGTPVGAWVFRFVTNDADSPVWMYLPITTPIATNTGDYTVAFDALGLSLVTSTT